MRKIVFTIIAGILILGGLGTTQVFAIDFYPPLTIPDPTPGISDDWGFPPSLSDNKVLVGAARDDTGAEDSGAAFLYDATDGSLLLTFLNPTPNVFDIFGNDALLDGNNAIISAPRDDTDGTDVGIVYLFDITTCDADISNGGTAGDGVCEAPTRTFHNPDPQDYHSFSFSLAVEGNNFVIGDFGYGISPQYDVGQVYIFDITTGLLKQTIPSPQPFTEFFFGYRLDISGNKILIGNYPGRDGYLYDLQGNQLLRFHDPAFPVPLDFNRFGHTLALEGNYAVLSAGGTIVGTNLGTGVVYLFDITTCDADISNGGTAGDGVCEAPTRVYNNPDPEDRDPFGDRLAMNAKHILIGVPQDDPNGVSNAGSAYLFSTQLEFLEKTFGNVPNEWDNFGADVDIDGDTILIEESINLSNPKDQFLHIYHPIVDTDDDGTPDGDDPAPEDPCVPDNTVDVCDADGDGVPNNEDACPNDFGLQELDGCPPAFDFVTNSDPQGQVQTEVTVAFDTITITGVNGITGEFSATASFYDDDTGVEILDDDGTVECLPVPLATDLFPNQMICTWDSSVTDALPAGNYCWMVTVEELSGNYFPNIVSHNGCAVTGDNPEDDADEQFTISVDSDGDGISNNIDTQPLTPSGDFSDGTTYGTVVDTGDQSLVITNDPNGIRIYADSSGGPIPAEVSICDGFSTVFLTAGDEIVVTCGSATVQVIQGAVEMNFTSMANMVFETIINFGNSLTIDLETSTAYADSQNSEVIIITTNGYTIMVHPDEHVELLLETPPLQRVPASNLRITDASGNSLNSVLVNQQIQIVADLTNYQNLDQDFTYLVQIQDEQFVTLSLSWISGSMVPQQSMSPAQSWMPTSPGTYLAQIFVWESVNNPTALSAPLSISIVVT